MIGRMFWACLAILASPSLGQDAPGTSPGNEAMSVRGQDYNIPWVSLVQEVIILALKRGEGGGPRLLHHRIPPQRVV